MLFLLLSELAKIRIYIWNMGDYIFCTIQANYCHVHVSEDLSAYQYSCPKTDDAIDL